MTSMPPDAERLPVRLSARRVLYVLVGVVATTVSVGLVLWLWLRGDNLIGKDLSAAQLDLAHIAASVAVAGGGAFALYLAVLRQQTADRTLAHNEDVAKKTQQHQERVAAATEADAKRRAVTEQYTKAVEQLGSEKAPVRLGALYALERLARDNEELRQTVVNVACAYLRMPFTIPTEDSAMGRDEILRNARPQFDIRKGKLHPSRMTPRRNPDREWRSFEEREVRLTAQRLIQDHTRTSGPDYWGPVDLNLSRAVLINFELIYAKIGDLNLTKATFYRQAHFYGSTFASLDASGAQFGDRLWFHENTVKGAFSILDAHCHEAVSFGHSTFNSFAAFIGSTHSELCSIYNCTFKMQANFDGMLFQKDASFHDTTFNSWAVFSKMGALARTSFQGTKFHDESKFDDAVFVGQVDFSGAAFATTPEFTGTRFGAGHNLEA
ncbi:pentapeptide repeat-containing protein [Kutzneria sp. NPDC051319]|uniref:pentapeptide repeat-containing protein n=1 Tax=Kutzneria sp. NPDC051319 TaxID=3155047 RepID=UPI0034356CF1